MLSHDDGMRLALEQACLAEQLGEIPVGAVVVCEGQVVGAGHNQTLSHCDPTAHAEVVALRAAARTLGNHRLDGCTLYVTLEPCAMCMGAIFHSRVAAVYFGAADPKTGACGSVLDLPAERRINHHCQVHGGVLQAPCAQHLSHYFARLRLNKRQRHRPVREDALRLPSAALSVCMEGVQSLPFDDLHAAQGLRVQVWQNPSAPQHPARLLLCLHGAMSWSTVYRRLLTAPLDGTTTVWAVDLPGHGGSDKTKKGGEFDAQFQLNVLEALLQRTSAPRVHLVAQDTGCELALHLARRHTDRIDGLTLCNPLCAERREFLHQGVPLRSRAQLLACLKSQCAGQTDAQAALAAPYPDTGHAAGLLHWFSTVAPCGPASVSYAVAAQTVAHVDSVFFAESMHFRAKFGLTFECHPHPDAGAYPGLAQVGIWDELVASMPRQ